jgi:hypothetical protein
VVRGTGEFDAEGTRHGARLPGQASSVNERLDPFVLPLAFASYPIS